MQLNDMGTLPFIQVLYKGDEVTNDKPDIIEEIEKYLTITFNTIDC